MFSNCCIYRSANRRFLYGLLANSLTVNDNISKCLGGMKHSFLGLQVGEPRWANTSEAGSSQGFSPLGSSDSHSSEELCWVWIEKVGLDSAALDCNSCCTISQCPQASFPQLWLLHVDCKAGNCWPCWWLCHAFCRSPHLCSVGIVQVLGAWEWCDLRGCFSTLLKYICDKAWKPLWSLLKNGGDFLGCSVW